MRKLWMNVVRCLILPLGANPVYIAQVMDTASCDIIRNAMQGDLTVGDESAMLRFDLDTALQKIVLIHSASSAQMVARGTKRKRHQETSSQRNRQLDHTLLPTGIQLSVAGKEEYDAGLCGMLRGRVNRPDNKPKRTDFPKSPWHSDDVHRYCALDPDLSEWVHECWDPIADLLCQCLPEDESMGEEYNVRRVAWREEWTTKNHVMFQDMRAESPDTLVRDICARIEFLAKS